MKLIRTFHPIGQGALYTERHFVDGQEFTLVYDCGSSSLEKNVFEKKIKSIFPENSIIDVLFISHFHSDHINGISTLKNHCEIKRVVLPFINTEAKVLIKVSNYISNGFAETRLIDTPYDYFGNKTTVITINERNVLSDESPAPPENNYTLNDMNVSRTVESGTVFGSLTGHQWFFIPFNYNNEELLIHFKEALTKVNLEIKDIDTISKIKINKKKIISAFKSIDKDLNKNSLILFSGCKQDDYLKCFGYSRWPDHFYCGGRSGCLYLGDIDLKQTNLVHDIKTKLGLYMSSIGTIQIPHHGSIHNFDSSIFEDRFVNAILSFGVSNTYGHPSDRVIEEILSHEAYPRFITEHQNSITSQWM